MPVGLIARDAGKLETLVGELREDAQF